MDGIKLDWNLFTGLGYISLIYFRSVSLYERQVINDLPLEDSYRFTNEKLKSVSCILLISVIRF